MHMIAARDPVSDLPQGRHSRADFARIILSAVTPAPVAGIHVFLASKQVMDGRNKSGHDGVWFEVRLLIPFRGRCASADREAA